MPKAFIITIGLLFAFALSLEANVKLNDLTRSNLSFKKSLNKSTYDKNNKEHRDSDKSFDTKNAQDNKKAFYDKDKTFNTNEYYDANKRARGLGNTYNSPELRSLDWKSKFYDENKELFFNNKDRSLNRDYMGRTDFSKTKNMETMTDRVYEDLMDRSMSDINKYHSQTAREDSTEGGIPVSSTSGTKKESSILDLLDFSTTNIENPSVNFSLPSSMSHMRSMPSADNPTQNSSPPQDSDFIAFPQAPRPTSSPKDPSIPDYSKGYVPPEQQAQTSSEQKKTYIISKPVKEDDAPTSIFGVPKKFNSGKVQISVEVKQK